MTSPCKSCRAPILWAHTPAGARMPLDAEPVKDGNIQLGFVGGEEMAIVLTNPADIAGCQVDGIPLYVSHFATCPNAAAHRRVPQPADSRVPLKEAGARSDAC